jgi:hypothetical protein
MTSVTAVNFNEDDAKTSEAGTDLTTGVKPTRAFLPAGMPEGTSILTLDGPIPVEHLQDGDRIITRNAGPIELKAVHSRMLQSVRPVMVAPGALGHGNPANEIILAPGQRVMLRGDAAVARFGRPEAIVQVFDLCDGESMMQAAEPMKLRVFTLDLGAEHVVYGDGVEVACTPPSERTRRPEIKAQPVALRRVTLERNREEPAPRAPVAVRRIKPRAARDVLILSDPAT